MAGGGVINLKQLIKLNRTLWGRGSGHFLHVSVGQSPRFQERFFFFSNTLTLPSSFVNCSDAYNRHS